MLPLLAQTTLPPDAIRRAADEVVARPYYQLGTAPRADATPAWLEVLRWILTPFEWLFESMEGLPDLIRWAIVILCVILCVALISHIFYTLVMAIRGPIQRRRQSFDTATREVDPVDLESGADELVAQGDYIGAIRLLFRASLRRIELAERRRFRPGFTNRELLQRYRATPLFASLARFVETIELKWYGNAVCDRTDYLTCRDEHGRIRQQVEHRATPVGT